jgi:hypothetical protein
MVRISVYQERRVLGQGWVELNKDLSFDQICLVWPNLKLIEKVVPVRRRIIGVAGALREISPYITNFHSK